MLCFYFFFLIHYTKDFDERGYRPLKLHTQTGDPKKKPCVRGSRKGGRACIYMVVVFFRGPSGSQGGWGRYRLTESVAVD